MKRKFSLDIVKGLFQTETMKESPPVHQPHSHLLPPKSVRPPLPPAIDAELRAICTFIVNDLKAGSGYFVEKPALDYEAIKKSGNHGPQTTNGLYKPISHQQPSEAYDFDGMLDGSLDPMMYRYKPTVAAKDIFKNEPESLTFSQRSAQLRADQLMGRRPAAALPPMPVESTEQTASTTAPVNVPTKQPARADSLETSTSSPTTDPTGSPWSDKGSTAITSAEFTPARGSKRTSSQATNSGFESGSFSKIEAVDSDWMRSKIEKQKKAQRAVNESTATAQASQTTKVPTRKPVPSQEQSRKNSAQLQPTITNASQRSNLTRAETNQSYDQGRSTSRNSRSRTRTPAGSQQDRDASEGRVSRSVARAGDRARSISRGVKEYFRPSRPSSPQRDQQSRKPSIDARPLKTSRSYLKESYRSRSDTSDVSGVAPQEHIDLNRNLPPLPSLDTWKPDDATPVPTKAAKAKSKPDLREAFAAGPGYQQTPAVPRKPINGNHIISQLVSSTPKSSIGGQMLSSKTVVTPSSAPAVPQQMPIRQLRKTDSLAHLDNPYLADTRRPSAPATTRRQASEANLWATYDFRKNATQPTTQGLSAEEYDRMYSPQYTHTVELSPTSSLPSVDSNEQRVAKWKWWQAKSANREKQQRAKRSQDQPQQWMEDVVRSGSNTGILVTDQVNPQAPIARY